MAFINELDKNTIDQIAAGEVVERPASVVKELVENAVDSGASAITVEIKGGGIDMIRVTDNGCGIEKSQIRKAFKRHATSKLKDIDDLFNIHTLGFRGEALSSISSVAQVDMITKTADDITGTRYSINGGEEAGFEEIGAPDGTSLIIRNLFYNTPARKKFLKTPQTEGSYIGDVMEHLALDNPTVSFHYINNREDKFSTSGNGDLKELIYRIYGRDISVSLVPIKAEKNGMTLEGYLGEPSINRSNRNFEIFFVNGRYVKDKIISKALEEGYKQYLMMHKFPFAVLHLRMDPEMVDVNVHPAKLEVRFNNQTALYDFIKTSVEEVLSRKEMIPDALLGDDLKEAKAQKQKEAQAEKKQDNDSTAVVITPVKVDPKDDVFFDDSEAPNKPKASPEQAPQRAPEPFEKLRFEENRVMEEKPVYATGVKEEPIRIQDPSKSALWTRIFGDSDGRKAERSEHPSPIIKQEEAIVVEKPMQLNLFDEKVLTKDNVKEYEILGQIFGTYWIIGFKDKMFLVDQHAAHEKVNYERLIKRYKSGDILSQMVNPPVIVTLTSAEEEMFLSYRQYFEKLGFNIENFGGHEYAMRAIPIDLFGCESEKVMFTEILDELSHETGLDRTPDVINYKIASMACKASVKGNTRMTRQEMEALLDELLTLDNPYNCPHGRPTIISMSKYEIDKKFKRVVE
ncbi:MULTISPECIES: DNA mismatch repair endonuclease MutL [unclassified Butyrivibrio]|uniref:DNA mismatch repair endonuclease MutL n=1 Tax=unclassified Butyrivibrio TaxID=2639466 RepID=UPI0003B78DDB|nr:MULTISPECIES: DNA mismatch repair endonuclease MutL [unclassified Butyrivibrio]MDC7295209.1 DNA mismatch repair endonuclease MutL [Butyrivibrio sp. DSM 10294]